MGALFVSLLTNVAILNGWGPGWREMFVGLSVVVSSLPPSRRCGGSRPGGEPCR